MVLDWIGYKMSAELACTYAALILNDDDVEITGDKITAILKVIFIRWVLNIFLRSKSDTDSLCLGSQCWLRAILAIPLRWSLEGRRCPLPHHQYRFRCWFWPSCRRCRRRWWWCCCCWSTKGRSQEGRILIRRRWWYGFRSFRLICYFVFSNKGHYVKPQTVFINTIKSHLEWHQIILSWSDTHRNCSVTILQPNIAIRKNNFIPTSSITTPRLTDLMFEVF